MTVLQENKSKITLQHLVALYQTMTENEDHVNATKISELYNKLDNDKYIVGFTGHFSAGKSSMINTLLDEDILPKSPIPTSGNIVEISSNHDQARIIFHNDTVKTYKQPYNIEAIQAFCKDNQTVKKVELSTVKSLLPQGCSLMDTPGIDAADDADRLMTESALHLVDALFYVMDYNHVQSEVNLTFLQKLQKQKIPFYIVVNQIDKHNESEISFSKFQRSVKQTFEQWAIHPEKIFYCSLFEQTLAYNEFHLIKEQLFTLLAARPNYPFMVDYATQDIIRAHKDFLADSYDQLTANSLTEGMEVVDAEQMTVLKEKLDHVQQTPDLLKKSFQFELNETLKNAYLMPATLRDKAQSFLESQQKDFKVGFFASKKKTEEEKMLRLNDFLSNLQDTITATIQWKLRDKIINLLNDNNFSDPSLLQFTKQFSIDYTAEDILSLIKPGATVNGEYVLRYTDEVSAHIKSKFKKEAQILWDKIHDHILRSLEESVSKYENELATLEIAMKKQLEVYDLQASLQKSYDHIDHILVHPNPDEAAWELITTVNNPSIVEQVAHQSEPLLEKILTDETQTRDAVMSQANSQLTVQETIHYIDETIDVIKSLPGFQTLVTDLQERKSKLADRKMTIALFGAFSAGKSSFANALIGEQLLPSSPNPTTAVINEIAPVTKQYTHGTVVIHLKDEQTLVHDILSLTKSLSPPKGDFSELVNWIQTENIIKNELLNKMYQAYLEALLSGYNDHFKRLGDTITIALNDFTKYITDETKACYIESVTLYYDCSLTRQGITLVDTPGADSVNARHTSVAFDYIKHADAILYVTYYNHAISRADRDFLIQLGRVKETFALDKMFFIINAADLATNETDLQLVTEYVEEQLLQLGIRHPNIFPISSKQSLEDKLQKQPLNEKMQAFETHFTSFINDDLAALSMQSATRDITRSYLAMKRFIETMSLNDQEKQAYKDDLLSKQEELIQMVEQTDVNMFAERIVQRIERQLYYVSDRFTIRFHDFFIDAFNPTTVTGTGKKARQSLNNCLRYLIDQTGYELLQELRAVSLRIELTLKNLIDEVQEDLGKRGQLIDDEFILPISETEAIHTPTYKQAFLALDISLLQPALNHFKGAKNFFERNEKDIMKEALYDLITPYMEKYIQSNADIMKDAYMMQWEKLLNQTMQQAKSHIEAYTSNHLEMLGEPPNMEVLNEKYEALVIIRNKMHTEDE